MKVTLKLSESLLSIYKETEKPLQEIMVLNLENPSTLREILIKADINPLMAPMIIIKNQRCQSLDYLIENDETITLIGPLAGG
ncbi:hypothetical protein [Sedimentibacter sp.]|uniref:hypothetical protein n=1 Tax=Sedimentibacter sp. TaxID=1960295 RepID=UPI0028AAEF0B|nr:hypothetical protein [Sedimentibacter sp.]